MWWKFGLARKDVIIVINCEYMYNECTYVYAIILCILDCIKELTQQLAC